MTQIAKVLYFISSLACSVSNCHRLCNRNACVTSALHNLHQPEATLEVDGRSSLPHHVSCELTATPDVFALLKLFAFKRPMKKLCMT